MGSICGLNHQVWWCVMTVNDDSSLGWKNSQETSDCTTTEAIDSYINHYQPSFSTIKHHYKPSSALIKPIIYHVSPRNNHENDLLDPMLHSHNRALTLGPRCSTLLRLTFCAMSSWDSPSTFRRSECPSKTQSQPMPSKCDGVASLVGDGVMLGGSRWEWCLEVVMVSWL